jgi:hypothetical protein
VDLHRAVVGREATVTSFVEALVAEAASAGILAEPHDGAWCEHLRHAALEAAVERALARSSSRWAHLPGSGPSDGALRLAGSSLDKLMELTLTAGTGDALDLDSRIRSLVRLDDEIETRLGEILARMADAGAWERLRFASSVHYAEQRLGLRRTAARRRVGLARALRRLPVVREAYAEGRIGAEAAWLVSRLLKDEAPSSQTQQLWVARAREATVKRLRDESRILSRRLAGIEDEPPLPARMAGSPRRRVPLPLDDAAWHAGPRRERGTALLRLLALGRRAAFDPGPDVFLNLRLPSPLARDFLAAVETARKRLARRVAEVAWDEPWPEPDPPGSTLAARECFVRGRGIPAWAGLLALLEDFAATWDAPGAAGRRRRGEEIFVRAGWRCMAPGCTSRSRLEEHHLIFRSHGGGDEDWNRVPDCRFHHVRGAHGGLATCRGRAPLDVVWTLGRDGIGGRFRNERKLTEG